MEFTKSYRTTDAEKVDAQRVQVTEKVELNEQAMERLVSDVMTGNFSHMTEEAAWDRLKEVGELVEYEEKRYVAPHAGGM